MAESYCFDDKTVTSTPKPVCSSSPSSKSGKNGFNNSMECLNDRSNVDSSELSWDIPFNKVTKENEAADFLERQHSLAKASLSRAESYIKGIPSRYLRPSEVSIDSTRASRISSSKSTITESDLLPINTSTPRNSIPEVRRTCSQGELLNRLSHCLRSSDDKTEDLIAHYLREVGESQSLKLDSSLFQSGEEAAAKLEKDEMSWKREEVIPIQPKEFSLVNNPVDKESIIGKFFRGRSDDPFEILPKSPLRLSDPVPLVEASSLVNQKESNFDENQSVSLSRIMKVLSDTNQTPSKAVEALCKVVNEPRKSQRSVPSRSHEESKKENINSLNTQANTSSNFSHSKTIRSASSLSSLPDGKLPIESTKTELVWGCLKIGKSETQDFIIRNKSPNRVKLQCTLSNPSFKIIVGGDVEHSNQLKVILQPFESRTIIVSFSPIITGAAIDKIYFTSFDSDLQQKTKQCINLFGYGGFGLITINTVVKDTVGKLLLSLGCIDKNETKRCFYLKNVGNLPSFAQFSFMSHVMHSFNSVKISPNNVVLLPDEEFKVEVTYIPKKEDFIYLHTRLNYYSEVIEMGKLTLMWGTEVDRWRLKKACERAKGLEIGESARKLTEKFHKEVMPTDLKQFRESGGSIKEIQRLFKSREVTLTIERDLDRTVVPQIPDDTQLFQSLCEFDSNLIDTITIDTFSVEPLGVILTSSKREDCIFLTNHCSTPSYFEAVSVPPGLKLMPSNGISSPLKTLAIRLSYDNFNKTVEFKVKIMLDNDSYEVQVKVLSL